MDAASPPKTALDGARDWLRQRDSYRAQLVAELNEARARVAEIESVLAEIGAPPAEPIGAPVVRPAPPVFHHAVRPKYPPKKVVQRAGQAMVRRRLPILVAAFDAKKATVAQVIARVVSENPDGMTAGEVLRGVLELKPGTKTSTVYPTIYRMRDDKRLRCEGEIGDSRYFPPSQTEAAE